MQVKRTNISETKFRLAIAADQTFLDSTKTRVLNHLASSHIKLPGFRAGKAPLTLVEKQVDTNLLQREFLDEAVNKLYIQAVKAEKLRPVANPEVSIKKFVPFSQLEFDAEVEAIGDIKLANYKSIKLKPSKVEINTKDINGVIDQLKKRLAKRTSSEELSKEGNELIIDFKGADSKGVAVQGAEGKDYPLILGDNTFIPGFETNLIGLKKEQEKTFSLNFPKDYGVAALQSKKVTFWVKVKQVNQLHYPKVDNDFAGKAGPFKTLAELKADIKKQLTNERQADIDREYENRLVSLITEKSTISVPSKLIDEQVESNEQAERQNLVYRSQTWQEHLKSEGVSEQEHRARNRPEAELNIKAGLILNEIAQLEGILVTPEELEIRLQLLRGQYKDQAMLVELDKPEARRDIENRLLTEKTIARLKSYAAS